MQVNNQFYYKSKNLRIKSLRDNNMSHNNLATFFSGTDTNTLLEEGTERNNFVSLIVNNAGDYKAAITRKAQHTKNINDNTSYSFFSEQTKRDVTSTYQVVEDCVEYYLLAIEKHIPLSWQELEERVTDIKREKKQQQKNVIIAQKNLQNDACWFDDYDMEGETLFSSRMNRYDHLYNPVTDSMYSHYDYPNLGKRSSNSNIITDNDVQEVFIQLISCNPLLTNKSKVDVHSWIEKMNTVFAARFRGKENEAWHFEDWATDYVEYLIYNKALELSDKTDTDQDEIEIQLAEKVIAKLKSSFKKQNKFVSAYITALEIYKEREY